MKKSKKDNKKLKKMKKKELIELLLKQIDDNNKLRAINEKHEELVSADGNIDA